MNHKFSLAIAFFLVCFALCEAALFVLSPAIQSSFRSLGTLPGRELLATIFAAMSVGCLIGIILTLMDMRLQQKQRR
ncbi:MAG TPA: hypothetical protein VHW66_22325 [Stellaceae bacterium]|jgi:hypothetical protein|nr:hypothetical protein [Stellaceae bacterium]